MIVHVDNLEGLPSTTDVAWPPNWRKLDDLDAAFNHTTLNSDGSKLVVVPFEKVLLDQQTNFSDNMTGPQYSDPPVSLNFSQADAVLEEFGGNHTAPYDFGGNLQWTYEPSPEPETLSEWQLNSLSIVVIVGGFCAIIAVVVLVFLRKRPNSAQVTGLSEELQ